MKDRRLALKIKIKSLTAEARIIRSEESKLRSKIRGLREWIRLVENKEGEMDGMIKERESWIADLVEKWGSIGSHCDVDIAGESRASLLAYACIRDRTRGERTQKPIDSKKIEAMVARFGCVSAQEAKEKLTAWLAKTETVIPVSG
jgi:predicted nuclease with TOPRIM domain